MNTTISISEELKDELHKIKIHPREPYQEVIKRLLGEHNDIIHRN